MNQYQVLYKLNQVISLVSVYKNENNQLKISLEFEMGQRLISGSLAHIGLLTIILTSTNFASEIEIIKYLIAPMIVGTNILRFILCKFQKKFYQELRSLWMVLFDFLLICTAISWGTLAFVVLNKYGMSTINSSIILLVCSGITAGAANSLNVDLFRAHFFILCLLAFPFFKLVSFGPDAYSIAFIFIVYFIFLSQQIKLQNKIFEDHLKSLQEISLKNKVIEDTLETKTRFLANMSHEIRTPLNGIIGISNLIEDSITNTEHLEHIRTIQDCSKNLIEIVNDVLDFSKLEANKVELEQNEINIKKLIDDIVKLFKPLTQKKNIFLKCTINEEVPEWIKGDELRIKQILNNLISNAIKFTDSGTIHVAAEGFLIESDKWKIQISVKDSGMGIPENLQKKLFQSFSQVDASTVRRFGGTGLGLAICKGLCEKMGGKIWVQSSVGSGSIFSFNFIAVTVIQPKVHELNKQNFKEITSQNKDLAINYPLNILVAEDIKTNQIVTLGILKKLGYIADVVSNGLEAVNATETKNYDLILMDCHMPVCDGFQATQMIVEKIPSNKRPLIYALSASYSVELLQQSNNTGMSGYLEKPIFLPHLIEVLKKASLTKKVASSLSKEESKVHKIEISENYYSTEINIDLKEFYSNFSEMDSFAHEVLIQAIETLPKMLIQLENAISNKSVKDITLSTHTISGVLANIYANQARAIVEKIEKSSRIGKFLEITEDLDKLKISIKEIIITLEEIVNNKNKLIKLKKF